MSSITEVKVPDIGDFKEVDVIEILVKPGDTVAKEASLITVESDKATMEIPSPAGGVVKELKVKLGDKVAEGSMILLLETSAGAAPAPQAAKPAEVSATSTPAPQPAAASTSAAEPAAVPIHRPAPVPPVPVAEAPAFTPHASPSVRKFARELGADLARVRGSGPKGRITQEDVQAFVKGVLTQAPAAALAVPAPAGGVPFNLPEWPQVDFAKFGPVEAKPLSRIRKLSGANLHRNWISIPHVTQFDEADVTELEAFRKESGAASEKQGFKLTMLAFLIKACVTALRQYPEFNASLDRSGENLVLKKYFHIGVAVDTPDGLVVPVIRDADRKGVYELARELAEVSKLAREKKAQAGRHARRDLQHFQPGRHRRHRVHAHHQRAGSRHPRRVQSGDAAGLGRRQGRRRTVPAAADAAAVAVLRSSRDRRRRRRALHVLPRVGTVRHPPLSCSRPRPSKCTPSN